MSTDIYFLYDVLTRLVYATNYYHCKGRSKTIRSRRGLVTKFAVVEGDDAEPDVEALQGYPEDV